MPYLNVSPSSPPHSPPCLEPRQTCLTLGLCWGAAAVWHGLGLVEACPSLPSTDAHWIDPDNAVLGSPSCSRIKDPEFCVICSNFEIKSIATNDTMFHLWQVLYVLWHLIEKKTQIYMFFLLYPLPLFKPLYQTFRTPPLHHPNLSPNHQSFQILRLQIMHGPSNLPSPFHPKTKLKQTSGLPSMQ